MQWIEDDNVLPWWYKAEESEIVDFNAVKWKPCSKRAMPLNKKPIPTYIIQKLSPKLINSTEHSVKGIALKTESPNIDLMQKFSVHITI